MARRKRKLAVKERFPDWKPPGLYDDKKIPKVPEETVSKAIDLIKQTCSEAVDHDQLQKQIQGVAIAYAEDRRMMEKPPLEWYRSRIEPMRNATISLLRTIRSQDGMYWPFLALVRHRMGRSLGSNSDPESIEQILEAFERVCAESIRQKGSPGAKQERHVQNAVKALSNIWLECTKFRIPLSLDTEIGPVKQDANLVANDLDAASRELQKRSLEEFTSPGPRFCQVVLQRIDPGLTVSQIQTAIRIALSKPRVRKPRTS
jgi:hypothetical protein